MPIQNHAFSQNMVKLSSRLQTYKPVNNILIQLSSSEIMTFKYVKCTKNLHIIHYIINI